MKLVGNYFSPFVRRVAVSLNALAIPFELDEVLVSQEPERVRIHNPVVRIPALILDDGEVLVESSAILDEIDQMAGPQKALVPPSGEKRRRVMQLSAIAMASMEKAQWAFYELRHHPKEKIHQPWIDQNDQQAIGGLRYLDAIAANASSTGWLGGTPNFTQADITAAVVFGSANAIRPQLELSDATPNLCRFAARCEEMLIFKTVQIPSLPASAAQTLAKGK